MTDTDTPAFILAAAQSDEQGASQERPGCRPSDQAPSGLAASGASIPRAQWQPCPMDTRLARTPYLVIPKLALQAMPMEWRERLEALLREADDAGLETPSYIVLRDDPEYARSVPEDEEDPYGPTDRVDVFRTDPWANYKYGNVQELSPRFQPRVSDGSQPVVETLVEGSERYYREWYDAVRASAMAARSGETQGGSTEGNSAVPERQTPEQLASKLVFGSDDNACDISDGDDWLVTGQGLIDALRTSRNEALEEAAKVAEDEDGAFSRWGQDNNTRVAQATCCAAATAIRALKDLT